MVAETLEAAIEGAEAVRPTFTADPFAAVIDSPGSKTEPKADVTFAMPPRPWRPPPSVKLVMPRGQIFHVAIGLA